MKLFTILSVFSLGMFAALVISCENQDNTFPDYEGGITVYFAHQYPVRTLVLGEDTYDTSLDNAHKCKIYATMGGAYEGRNVKVAIVADNTLTNHLYFGDGAAVQAMPSAHYSLSSQTLDYGGTHMGAVEVQFTDAFFADPAALVNTYVIPLRMTGQTGADQILTGTPKIESDTPDRCNSEAWDVFPMDYVLYCVKFINPWHAYYLRRGIDQITENGTTTSNVRHAQYVENDEICSITTAGLKKNIFPVSTTINESGTVKTLTCDLELTFNDSGECSITSVTMGYTASGSGKFVKKGDIKSWGDKDRDVLYLEYNVDFNGKKYATKDTLVVQSRGVAYEEFKPIYQAN